MEEGGIEEERFLGESDKESRWVDGSEVDSESNPWFFMEEEDPSRQTYGYMKRRLVKKPKRVNSLDAEAMEIAASQAQHSKV